MTRPERPHTTPDAGMPAPAGRMSPAQRWMQVVTAAHTPRKWAAIADAIRTADAARYGEFGQPIDRGDGSWCAVAVAALERPTSAAELPHLPDGLPGRCFLDPDLLAAWLNTPTPYSQTGRVVADSLHLPADWDLAGEDEIHQALHHLLTAAQRAGVFGVAGHHIELHATVDPDGRPAGYLIVVRPDTGPGLASRPVPTDLLVTDSAASTSDGIVHALHAVAAAVDDTLDSHDGQPVPAVAARGGPFRPLAPAAMSPPATGAPKPSARPVRRGR